MVSLIEQFTVSGSHFEVGYAIGKRFASKIHQAFDNYAFFQQKLLPFHRTAEGQTRFKSYLKFNQSRYPDYLAELEGMAQGAGYPFEEMLLINLRGEYREYFHELNLPGCSDCVVLSDEVALIGHNEDGAPEFRDNIYLVQVQIEDKPAFTALSYPGFLSGNALGFNNKGVCFSVDNVQPLDTAPGVGRHFVARSLLEATSLDDAIKRATVPNRASGFHYNIGSSTERRIVSLETAPTIHAGQEIKGCYFHANHYQTLDIEQLIDGSSASRVQSCAAIMQNHTPATSTDILTLLGDTSNPEFPIHRQARGEDNLATFCSALFNLDTHYLQLYTAHPIHNADQCLEVSMK